MEVLKRKSASDAPTLFRVNAKRGLGTGKVDREARLIQDVSVITMGEALGHDLWIDETFLDQVVKTGNKLKIGAKSRFTHPGLSADGMGTQIGRVKHFIVDGTQVRADWHLYEKSNSELVDKVLDLAEEDPEAFGASLVFNRDFAAEEAFSKKYADQQGRFISPAEENQANLPHIRLSALSAADVVDDPAANPDGLFGFTEGSEMAAQAEAVLAFAFGLTDKAPPESWVGPHPERVKAFLKNFLSRHGLELQPVGTELVGCVLDTTDDGRMEALEEKVKAMSQNQERINSLVGLLVKGQKDS